MALKLASFLQTSASLKQKQTAGGALLILFLVAPYLPRAVLDLTVGNRLGALLVLLGAIYFLKMDMVLGVAAFLAAAALFLEHRRRVVTVIQEKLATVGNSRPATLREAARPARDLVPGEVHPPFDSPDVTDHEGGIDEKYDGGHDLDAEAPAVNNQKTPLETESNLGEVTHYLQSKGFNTA